MSILNIIKSAGLSQRATCKKLGVSYPTLHKWNDDPSWMRISEARALLMILPSTEKQLLVDFVTHLFLS